MTLERLTQITSVGITSGITLNNATLTGVTTIASLDSVSVGGTITAVNGTFSGNVSIAGTLTYEDVTNIDSVGLITARSGIHVTGGSVGIGTDNPLTKLHTDGTVFAGSSGFSGSLYGGVRIAPNNGSGQAGGVIYGGVHNDNNTAIFLRRGYDTTLNTIDFNSYGGIRFFTNGALTSQTEKLRITSSGNVGIGTDNPTTELEVLGGGTVASFRGTGGSSFIGIKDEDDGTLGFIGVDGGSIKLQTSGSSYADKLVVDTDGRVTMPYQPAFVAYLSTNYSYTGSGSRQLVPFDSTLTNIGGHFNTTNKRFVAPVAGMYIFTASLVCNSGSSSTYFSCDIWVNGSTVPGSNGWQNMGAGYQIQRSSLITYLAVNDYVDVRMEKSANDTINSGTGYSGFTGALLG